MVHEDGTIEDKGILRISPNDNNPLYQLATLKNPKPTATFRYETHFYIDNNRVDYTNIDGLISAPRYTDLTEEQKKENSLKLVSKELPLGGSDVTINHKRHHLSESGDLVEENMGVKTFSTDNNNTLYKIALSFNPKPPAGAYETHFYVDKKVVDRIRFNGREFGITLHYADLTEYQKNNLELITMECSVVRINHTMHHVTGVDDDMGVQTFSICDERTLYEIAKSFNPKNPTENYINETHFYVDGMIVDYRTVNGRLSSRPRYTDLTDDQRKKLKLVTMEHYEEPDD